MGGVEADGKEEGGIRPLGEVEVDRLEYDRHDEWKETVPSVRCLCWR